MPTRAIIHSLVEGAPHLAWSNRPDGSTECINRQLAEYAGMAEQRILGDPFSLLVHPEDLPTLLKLREENVPKEQAYCLEYRLRRADGRYRWHSAHVAPVRDAAGRLIAWYGSALDIHDRRETAEALRQSEARFRAVFESAAIGVARVAFEGAQWLEVNDAFCRILGYAREDLIGKPWLDFTHPEDIEIDLKSFERMAAGEIDTYAVEKRFIHKLGYDVWARLTLSLVRDAEGRPDFEVCLVEDISDRKRSEEALRRSNEDLERFAYVAGHDLQEPLRHVTSYAQLLERKYGDRLDGDAAQFLQHIVDGTRRMHKLIREILEMARPATQIESECFDSGEVLQDAIRAVGKEVMDTGATITAEPLPKVVAPKAVVAQTFQNLLSNAIKYRHPQRVPAIYVRGDCQDRQWVFSISDNGQGIPPEYQDLIFQWFRRIPGQKESGSGIGLASVRRMLERVGGRVWMESEAGAGSTFHFSLPAPRGTTERSLF